MFDPPTAATSQQSIPMEHPSEWSRAPSTLVSKSTQRNGHTQNHTDQPRQTNPESTKGFSRMGSQDSIIPRPEVAAYPNATPASAPGTLPAREQSRRNRRFSLFAKLRRKLPLACALFLIAVTVIVTLALTTFIILCIVDATRCDLEHNKMETCFHNETTGLGCAPQHWHIDDDGWSEHKHMTCVTQGRCDPFSWSTYSRSVRSSPPTPKKQTMHS